MDLIMETIDIDRAESILLERPDLVYSDAPLPDDLPDEELIGHLRAYIRCLIALRLVEQWRCGIETRGRLVGLGEYSARITEDGRTSTQYDAAISRFGGLPGEVG
ncbi:hypothetical protein TALC_00374 [Thermoplasmatales archaeon BRNA1]|nr:hypothetical protein TALC_00374 [Thermoplasmatales archaeon BRNA1]